MATTFADGTFTSSNSTKNMESKEVESQLKLALLDLVDKTYDWQ